MANLLQNQYESVFTKPDHSNIDQAVDAVDSGEIPEMPNVTFSTEDIVETIDTLSFNAASGPDGFPAALLKNCKSTLATPLALFWRNCLELDKTPLLLKTSDIAPIFKGGDQGDASNYQPVALTSHITKIFEKVIRKKMVEHFKTNKLFNDSQH